MEFIIKAQFKASPKEVYDAWLDSESHSQMTGGEAHTSQVVGEKFSAWDGYIEGENIALKPYQEIVQSWRTNEFETEEEDSQIQLIITKVEHGTELKLVHTKLPAHGMQYKQGWEDNYFTPMTAYFSK